MEHVGWPDVRSALRYIDVPSDAIKSQYERGAGKRHYRQSWLDKFV